MIKSINNPKVILLMTAFLLTIGAVQAQCMANFTSSETNGVVTFTNNSTGVGPGSVAYWDFGDGSQGTSTAGTSNTTHTYASNGVYLACVIVSDSLAGCTSTFCDSVLVTGATTPPPCMANFTYTVSGGTVSFTNTSTNIPNGSTASWSFGDGNSASTGGTNGTTHTYSNNGNYAVCLTVTNTFFGCSSTYCDSVNITGAGTGGNCTAGFTYSGSNGTFAFTNTSSNLPAGSVAAWDFGDGTQVATLPYANTQHTYSSNGDYLVCLTVMDSANCSDTFCDSVSVTGFTGPPCQASYWWVPDSTGQYSILLINTSSGNAPISYYWDFGDGNTSTQSFPSHTYAGAGTYVVCVTISDNSGCTSTFCDSIVVTNKVNVPFSINVVSPMTSIPVEPTAPELVAFPNPFNERLVVELDTDPTESVTLQLLDITGKVVRNEELAPNSTGSHQHEFATGALPEGIYLLKISTPTSTQVKKLVHF